MLDFSDLFGSLAGRALILIDILLILLAGWRWTKILLLFFFFPDEALQCCVRTGFCRDPPALAVAVAFAVAV